MTELVLLGGSVKGVIAGAKGARAAYVLGRQALNEAAQAVAKGMAAIALGAGGRGSVLVLISTLTADGRLVWQTIAVPVEQLAEAAKLGLGAGGELASGGFILQMGAEQGGGGSGESGKAGAREETVGQAEEGGAGDGSLEQWQAPSDWRLPTNGKWESQAAKGNCWFEPSDPKSGLSPQAEAPVGEISSEAVWPPSETHP